jgi:hypothetical protein
MAPSIACITELRGLPGQQGATLGTSAMYLGSYVRHPSHAAHVVYIVLRAGA